MGSRVPSQVGVPTGRADPGRGRAQRRPAREERVRPAVVEQRVGRDAGRVTTDEGGGAGEVRPEDQRVPGGAVGCPALIERVVAVVPDDDQTDPAHRREGGGAWADRGSDSAAADSEEAPVPFRRTSALAEHNVASRPIEDGQQRLLQSRQVPRVRHHDDHPAAAGQGGGHRCGDLGRPPVAGRSRPDCPRRAAGGQRVQERDSGRVVRPRARVRRLRAGGRLGCGRRLDASVPRWHSEAQDVGHRAGVAVGERAGKHGDLGGDHRFGRHQG